MAQKKKKQSKKRPTKSKKRIKSVGGMTMATKRKTVISRVSSVKNALPITKAHGISAAGGAAVAFAEGSKTLDFIPGWAKPLAVAMVAEKVGYRDASLGAAGVFGYKMAHKYNKTTPTAGSMEDVGDDPDKELLEKYANTSETSGTGQDW